VAVAEKKFKKPNVDFYVDDNDDLPKYTLEEYISYLRAPQWVLEGCASEAEYVNQYCEKVKTWYNSSRDAFRNEKEKWQVCYERLQETQKTAARAASILEDAVAAASFPIMRNSMLEEIASLYAGQYAPVFKALSKETQPMVSLANRYLLVELVLNDWDTLKFELGVDGFVADIWITKIYTDDEDPGPFGEEQRIVIDRVAPMNCYPDPKAPRWKWSNMEYFIYEESLEIGVCRNRYPDRAKLIDRHLSEPDDPNKEKWAGSQLMFLTGQKRQWQSGQERNRIQTKECWLHDERMRFRAYEESYTDSEGNSKDRVQVDDDGYVIGQWERAYPNGRMIVTAADRIILRDVANPYWHKELPFEFCPMGPQSGGKLFSVGKAAAILGIERKTNDIESRVHSYAQSETERPMIVEHGALPTNAQWFNLNTRSRGMIIKNKGYEIYRPPPIETPQFLPGYLSRLGIYKNQTMGMSGILQGEIPEGMQMSAQGIQNIQGNAQSRMNMESVYVGTAMKRIGNKFLWLMRQTYKADMSAQVFTPTGEEITVAWNADAFGTDYFTSIDIAANQPGGQQQIIQQAINLKRESLVDRPYCLSVSGIEGWEQIDQRMNKKRQDEIQAQAFARSFGVQVKKAEKDDQGPVQKPK
jgi:hypothetical protein